jgi:hypothetical protein
MKATFRIFLLIFFCSISLQSFSQSKIETSKRDLKKGTTRSSSNHNQSSSSSDDRDSTLGQQILQGVLKGIMYVTYYSTIGNYQVEDHLHNRVARYPYYNEQSGNYLRNDSSVNAKNHFRLDVDYHFLYSNRDLTGHHVTMNIRPFQYFYLQADLRALHEVNFNNTHSSLSLYHFNLCYDRIRFKDFNLGWKLGMCYVANDVKAGGFSGGLNAEAFIVKPFSLHVSKEWGAIHGVAVNEFELAGKYHIKRYHLLLGYQHLKIGSPKYDYISIGVGGHL